jgi:hypothetical protein
VGLTEVHCSFFFLADLTLLRASQNRAKMAPISAPLICEEISLSVAQAAAGSQFVPKLTGGVNKTDMILGATQVQITAPIRPKPKQKLNTLYIL